MRVLSGYGARSALLLTLVGALLAAPRAAAQPLEAVSSCAALPAEAKQTARSILANLHPYDGCDETFEKCLARDKPHPVVTRVAADLCRQVQAGRSKADIERALAKRGQSALSLGRPAKFALDESTRAGPADAPVTAVVYACARCPFCKVFVPALHRAVSEGPLQGKVRLYFRPFPLKDHPGATEGGLAMLSAARAGAFWPYLLRLYQNYDSFCPKLLTEWAGATGIDRDAFDRSLADAAVREALVAAKQEGLRNKVAATPTLFINGRRYVYELNLEAAVDVLLEEHERIAAGQ